MKSLAEWSSGRERNKLHVDKLLVTPLNSLESTVPFVRLGYVRGSVESHIVASSPESTHPSVCSSEHSMACFIAISTP